MTKNISDVGKMSALCVHCGELYTPDKEQVDEWANSGRAYDPTDWECPDCLAALDAYYEDLVEDENAEWERLCDWAEEKASAEADFAAMQEPVYGSDAWVKKQNEESRRAWYAYTDGLYC